MYITIIIKKNIIIINNWNKKYKIIIMHLLRNIIISQTYYNLEWIMDGIHLLGQDRSILQPCNCRLLNLCSGDSRVKLKELYFWCCVSWVVTDWSWQGLSIRIKVTDLWVSPRKAFHKEYFPVMKTVFKSNQTFPDLRRQGFSYYL